MTIAIAADHNGVELKTRLIAWLTEQGHTVDDRGVNGPETVDYPALCVDLGHQLTSGAADRAIMIGGTGSGETMALNKLPGVRATLCHQEFLAEITRANNDGNALVLGAKVIAFDLARRITGLWLATEFTGGRHQHRLDQLAAIERGEPLPPA